VSNAARSLGPTQPFLGEVFSSKPFLKWVGGKRQLLEKLRERIPAEFGTYHEPFVGGGALFFALRPAAAVLSDTNTQLIRAFRGVQQDVERVIARLQEMPISRDFFLALRKHPVDEQSDTEVAAWMIYLNKTAYNGLYRVNRRGEFNVPFGRYENPRTCDPENLRACSQALGGASLFVEDFSAVLHRAKRGDLVYFDPPYIPVSVYSNFARYTAEQFRLPDHQRLRDVALELKARGVHVLISNSVAPEVFSLYETHFKIERLRATRFVNSNPHGRGKVIETLMY